MINSSIIHISCREQSFFEDVDRTDARSLRSAPSGGATDMYDHTRVYVRTIDMLDVTYHTSASHRHGIATMPIGGVTLGDHGNAKHPVVIVQHRRPIVRNGFDFKLRANAVEATELSNFVPRQTARGPIAGSITQRDMVRVGRSAHAFGIAQVHPSAERLEYLGGARHKYAYARVAVARIKFHS